eukprot:1812895-Pyramimonas_sp.AAC.1
MFKRTNLNPKAGDTPVASTPQRSDRNDGAAPPSDWQEGTGTPESRYRRESVRDLLDNLEE